MNRIVTSTVVIAGIMAAGGPAALAQPAPSRATAPTPDAAKILDEARAALAHARSLSYDAKVLGMGALEGKVPGHSAEVSASKADAGGWKLYAKGSQTGGEGGTPVAFEIGYDGVTARALREADKVIVEKTVQEWQELPTFFATQSARPVIAWEILDEKTLDATGKPTSHVGQEKVGGEMCDVIQVGTPSDKGAKFYIGVGDHLPRRIDRFEPAAEGAAPGVRRLEISNLQLNEKSTAGAYMISAPEGYAVRVAKREKPKPTGDAAGKKLGDPDDTRAHLAKRGQINEGDMAPAFSLKDAKGKTVSLAELKGKVVVIDFWGTWCPWCVKAMPQLQKVHEKYQGKDVVVLGMNIENSPKAKPVEFMQRNKITYNTLLEAQDAVNEYKVSGFPTLFVIDQAGKVVFKEKGFSPNLFEKVSQSIDKALAK